MHSPRVALIYRNKEGGACRTKLDAARPKPSINKNGMINCTSVERDGKESWLLRDRIRMYEQYIPRAPRIDVQIAQEKVPRQNLVVSARSNPVSNSPETSDEIGNISIERHRNLLIEAVNRQTNALTKEFADQLNKMTLQHEQKLKALRKKHEKECSKLAEEVTRGITREQEMKMKLGSMLKELSILSHAYEECREKRQRKKKKTLPAIFTGGDPSAFDQ